MSSRLVRSMLVVALVATVAAAVYPTGEPGVIGATERAPAKGVRTTVPDTSVQAAPARAADAKTDLPPPTSGAVLQPQFRLDLANPGRKPSVIVGGDPFVLPLPPAPPAPRPRKVAPAPPPQPPQAPPLPFRMIGSIVEDGKLTVFAARANGDVVSLRVAEIIDNTYRVESIDNQVMTLTYMPLNLKQTMPLEGIN